MANSRHISYKNEKKNILQHGKKIILLDRKHVALVWNVPTATEKTLKRTRYLPSWYFLKP